MKPKETNIGQIQELLSLRIYLEVKEANLRILVISDICIKGKTGWIQVPDAGWRTLWAEMENGWERAWVKVFIMMMINISMMDLQLVNNFPL